MITDLKTTATITDYLNNKYEFKKKKKDKLLKKYIEFYEFILFKYSSSFIKEKKEVMEYNTGYVIKQNKGEFHLRLQDLRSRFSGSIGSKFIKSNSIHSHYKAKDIRIADVLISDFLDMKIIKRISGKRKINENNFIPAIYTIVALEERNAENINVIFEQESITGNVIFDFDYQCKDLQVDRVRLNELLKDSSISFHTRMYNYYKLKNFAKNGLITIKTEKITNRKHTTLTSVGGDFRSLIRTKEGNIMINIDLKSSHLFWLAEITKNRNLYNEIKNNGIKSLDKKKLLTWLNTKEHNSNYYKKINNYMCQLGVNTSSLRNKDSQMYFLLAKIEADYVLGISEVLTQKGIENFTVHDQIYYEETYQTEVNKIISSFDEKLFFIPIWSEK